MAELKQCPFCGGKARIMTGISHSIPNYPRASVVCEGCRVSTCDYEDTAWDGSFISRAIKAWNKRVGEWDE